MLVLRSLFTAVLGLRPKQILFLIIFLSGWLEEKCVHWKVWVDSSELYFNLQYGMMMESIAFYTTILIRE